MFFDFLKPKKVVVKKPSRKTYLNPLAFKMLNEGYILKKYVKGKSYEIFLHSDQLVFSVSGSIYIKDVNTKETLSTIFKTLKEFENNG